MKKKILVAFLFALMLMFVSFTHTNVKAESYDVFQELTFKDGNNRTLIEFWNEPYINLNLKKLDRRMFGWSISYTNRRVPFTFISETLYSVRNTGTQNITHTFKYTESRESTIKRKTKGSLGVDGATTSKSKFKFGLDAKLEYTYESTISNKHSTTDQIKVVVAPNSELRIDMRGEGYFYQGFASDYFFFIPSHKGAFEYVLITTKYYSINMWTVEEAPVNEE